MFAESLRYLIGQGPGIAAPLLVLMKKFRVQSLNCKLWWLIQKEILVEMWLSGNVNKAEAELVDGVIFKCSNIVLKIISQHDNAIIQIYIWNNKILLISQNEKNNKNVKIGLQVFFSRL